MGTGLIPAIFWPGSGSSPIGNTSLGLYEDDDLFVNDAPLIASWVASRLGYPIMAVELTDRQIYDMFVEAITEYSSQVNEFNIRENMLAIQGASTASSFTQRLVKGSPLPFTIEVAQDYGTEAGAGGNVDWKRGYIDTTPGQQQYDLQQVWANVSESGNRIEIRKIWHDRSPAISRGGFGFGDVGVGPNDASNNLLGEFGWAGFDGGLNGVTGAGTAGQFLIMPMYETLLRVQAIELNDEIRRSQYSFELINNKITFTPVPVGERIYFQYLVTQDKFDVATGDTLISGSQSSAGSIVSDYSNAPYTNIPYSTINDVGKRWIRKYTLMLCKETLGRILSKYENMPIPNAEVRLDGELLRQEAEKEKSDLWEQLRESLAEAGRQKQFEKNKQNIENQQEILRRAPMGFYIF